MKKITEKTTDMKNVYKQHTTRMIDTMACLVIEQFFSESDVVVSAKYVDAMGVVVVGHVRHAVVGLFFGKVLRKR